MTFALLVLVTWRLTSLFVEEDGPLDMFARFRSFTGVYYDEYSNKLGRNLLSKALLCFWCFSLWVAAPLSLFLLSNSVKLHEIPIYWLALSASAIFLNELIDRLGE